jgi:LacI family transcriptional regulator
VGKRVTLLDIAAAAGVSRATVSLVLRNEPRVGAETRERVLETMTELGYVYDRRAANLRTQRSMTIGLIVTDVRNPYFAELTMALESPLDGEGYALLQGYSYDDSERERRLLDVMLEHRVDGIVLLPAPTTTAARLDEALNLTDTPHVLIARRVPRHRGDYVGADNVLAGRLLGDHLRSCGYKSVALLGGPRSSARSDRRHGLKTSLVPHGISFNDDPALATSANAAGGTEAVDLLLADGPLPDAVACYNDLVAFGVLPALRAAGIEPGRDVAVGSFDDVGGSEIQHPPLTSVATYPDRIGTEAAGLLLERIADPDLEPRKILLKPELTVRESSLLGEGLSHEP